MDSKELLKLFVKIDNSLVFIYNQKNKIVKESFFGGEDLCPNGTILLSEFKLIVADKFNIELGSSETHFYDNFKNAFKQEVFHFPAVFKDKNKKPIKLQFKGCKINSEEVLVYISQHEDKDFSEFDDLTKCVNRQKFDYEVNKAIKKNKQFILVLIDVDNFKEFNTKYGHVLGDIALIETAAKLKDIVGTKGWVCRVGGDEFLLMIEIEDDYDICHEFLFNTHLELSKSVNNLLNVESNLTYTFGSCQYPSDGDNYQLLLKKCQKALLRGKKKARNCFIMYLVEKCGPVTLEDQDIDAKFDDSIDTNSNFSIITAIIEIVNSDHSFEKNIMDSLELLGTFFVLDRVSLIEQLDSQKGDDYVKVWYNPKSIKHLLYATEDDRAECMNNVESWQELLGKSNLIKIDDVYQRTEIKIYDELIHDSVQAIVAIELKFNNKIFGIIKFEMTSISRVWDANDISSFILIAKILSIKYYKEYEDALYNKQLFYDSTTGLYNYRKWKDDVLKYISKNDEINDYSIMDITIYEYRNLFSLVEIKYMESVLKHIAFEINNIPNKGVIACRVQEGEFLFFIPHNDVEKIRASYNLLVRSLSELTYDKSANIVFTSGLYLHNGELGITESVDKAVLARKVSTPSNNFVIYDEEMSEREKKNLELSLHIETALKNNEFLLYLQPKISTKTGKLVGAEALTRWLYKGEKLIFPNDFIPMLEKNGYIIHLDYIVFENVCRFQRKCIDDGLKVVPISVNVSRAVGDFDAYLSKLDNIRNKYNIPSYLIEIEITEGMYTENEVAIKQFIEKLHDNGFSVSMDDFGSGYSNISSLSHLNFDTIKFDKSFLKDINNKKETKIISAIIPLVKSLNMNVLCEGVETNDYAEYLRKAGCDIIQGYLYDKPLKDDIFKNKYLLKNNLIH